MAPTTDSIFTSCRKGDLERIRYLVEKKEIDLNVRDCWDSTPLYYACHCGHQKVVEFLLANGARCKENTFDGERCLYGALTLEIKTLLLNSKLVNTTDKKRDDFDEFCEKMMRTEEFSDISLFLGHHEFKLHRCVLAARSQYFKTTLSTKWKHREIRTNAIDPKVFSEFVYFLYTGRIQVDRELFQDIFKLAEKCAVRNLTDLLTAAQAEAENFEQRKERVKISTLMIDNPLTRCNLVEDFETAINAGLPDEFGNPFYYLRTCAGVVDESEEVVDPNFDLCLKVEGHHFYCHKVFVCCRSEYFNALVQDHFREIDNITSRISLMSLRHVKPSVLTCVLNYIYTNSPISINQDIILEVLEAADLYLLPGLKKPCGTFLSDLISLESVVEILKICRMHDLQKLESSCAEFIAENISDIVADEEFHVFVVSDAHQVSDRQETDTISIIDDVRYHITSKIGSFSEMEEAQSKLKIIDDLLEKLGLDA